MEKAVLVLSRAGLALAQQLRDARPKGIMIFGPSCIVGACEKPGPEFVRFGTFHSHAELAPYHSQTDVDDEVGENGMHVTAGYLHRPRPEFAASFVVNATRFRLNPADVLAPFGNFRRPAAGWLEQIAIRPHGYGGATLAAPAAREGMR